MDKAVIPLSLILKQIYFDCISWKFGGNFESSNQGSAVMYLICENI